MVLNHGVRSVKGPVTAGVLISCSLLLLVACASSSRQPPQHAPESTAEQVRSSAATPGPITSDAAAGDIEPSPPPTWTVSPSPTPGNTPAPSATPACQESGQIVFGRFPSAIAYPDLAYRIYLPPCYGRDGRVYPALYMLPGNVYDDSIWDELGLDEAAETGINDGRLPPMLIVMPEGGSIADQTSGGPYSYEAVIVTELIPFVESSYCAWPEAAGRAIGGMSRGGYWSLEIAFRNPVIFSSVGGHSAALIDSYAGPDLDPKYTALTADLSSLRVYLDAGQSDWTLGQLEILHDNLLSRGKDHLWTIQPGSHDNDYWSSHVGDYVAWYAAVWPKDRGQLPSCELMPPG
jgi:enterochelin esterase-like enzyme